MTGNRVTHSSLPHGFRGVIRARAAHPDQASRAEFRYALGNARGVAQMNIRRRGLLALVIGLSGLGISAQEGHPLTGTWAGDWGGADAARRTHLTVVMNWDGKAITGLINPGPAAIPLRTVRVNWANWTVRID